MELSSDSEEHVGAVGGASVKRPLVPEAQSTGLSLAPLPSSSSSSRPSGSLSALLDSARSENVRGSSGPGRPAPKAKRRRVTTSSDEDWELAPEASPTDASCLSAAVRGGFEGGETADVTPLVAMGFDAESAAAALVAAGGDIAAAAEALAEGSGAAGGSSGPSGGSAAAAAPAVVDGEDDDDGDEGADDDDPSGVDQLQLMGFERKAAAVALAAAGGDVARAAEALLEGPSVSNGSAPSAPARRVRPPAAGRAAAPAQVTPARGEALQAAPVDHRGALAAISGRAKDAIVAALAGPDASRKGRVERSIGRGRVALRDNLWADHEHDHVLEGLSTCYAKLKAYQRAAVRWLLALAEKGLGGILADEMGLGKTAETLAFLDLRLQMQRRAVGSSAASKTQDIPPSLVVVPASLMGNWLAEVQSWCPHFKVFQYYGPNQGERAPLADEYFAGLQGRCHLILTTPGVLSSKVDRGNFFRKLHFDYLIYDEAHGVKNSGAQKFQDIYRGLQVDHRLLLTGTPVQNSLRELGNLLTLLLAQNKIPDGVRKPPRHREALAAIEELNDLVERGVLRTLQVRAAPFILRRLKKDVMKDLPAKTGNTVHCALEPAQQAQYTGELLKAKAECVKMRARRDFVKNLFARLRRICNHPLLGQSKFSDADYEKLVEALRRVRPDFQKATLQKALGEVRGWSDYEVAAVVRDYGLSSLLGPHFTVSRAELMEGSAKVAQLVQLLQDQRKAGRKTLVFSQFTQFLDLIADVLKAIDLSFARLDGATNVGERPEIVRNFQDPTSGVDVFLLSTKAGGVGLNLTAADSVVLMDLSFNPQDNRQAEDRVHRLGQTRPVSIYYFVCRGTIEEQVLKINLNKMALDYKFGGQKMLLQAEGPPKAAAAEDAPVEEDEDDKDEEEEEEDEEVDTIALQKQAKKAEQEVFAELERACAAL